jgi:hypothetical protein
MTRELQTKRVAKITEMRDTIKKERAVLLRATGMLNVFKNLKRLGVIVTNIPVPTAVIDPDTSFYGTEHGRTLIVDNITQTQTLIDIHIAALFESLSECEHFVRRVDKQVNAF